MITFCLASTEHGPLLVNRLDYHHNVDGWAYGIGCQLFESGHYEPREVGVLKDLLKVRRKYYGDGVVALDCGANIGVHAVEFAKMMTKWGHVVAIEAQERIFYALCGNLTLQNCLNARALFAAVGGECGELRFPEPNYTIPSSFGSFELKQRLGTEPIGQPIDYDKPTLSVQLLTIDSLGLERCDLIKIDVEGMEEEALAGALYTVKRCKPILYIETVKVGPENITKWCEDLGYQVLPHGVMNVIAIHKSDQTIEHVDHERVGGPKLEPR